MQTSLFVGSVSNAMRGKRLLEKHGIRTYMRKISTTESGCGYSLMISTGVLTQAASLLRADGVQVQHIEERDVR